MDNKNKIETFIERFHGDEELTLGRFHFLGEVIYTLELPWKDNQSNISCIPEGTYTVEKTYSNRFKKDLWLVKNVPNRSGIRFHTANYVSQLQGCIAPGLETHDLNKDGILDITNSKKALTIMNELLPDVFTLDVIWNKQLKLI